MGVIIINVINKLQLQFQLTFKTQHNSVSFPVMEQNIHVKSKETFHNNIKQTFVVWKWMKWRKKKERKKDIKRMKERMSERMNWRMKRNNEWKNEWENEKKERMNARMNRKKEWKKERKKERKNRKKRVPWWWEWQKHICAPALHSRCAAPQCLMGNCSFTRALRS